MTIRPTRQDEWPSLASFLSANGIARRAEDLQWQYGRSEEPDDPAGHSFLAEIDGKPAGHIGVLPTTIRSLGQELEPLEAGWFVDWVVRKDLRDRGLGVLLLREALNACPTLMTIQGTPQTRAALAELNWTQNQRLGIYRLPVCLGSAAGSGLARRAAVELARRIWWHPVQHDPPPGWSLDRGPTGLHEAQRQLKAAMSRIESSGGVNVLRFGRSPRFLSWSFLEHPDRRYRLGIVRDAGTPAGYAVWRMLPRPDGRFDGRIVDLGCPWDRPDVWPWLVSAVTARLVDAGAVQIDALSGTDAPLAAALADNRYLLRQRLPLWTSPETPGLSPATPWHLTFADSDIDTAAER